MSFVPAFRYRLRDSARSVAIFAGVLVLVQIFIIISFLRIAGEGTMSGNATGYSIAAAIFVFVTGICTPREQLRLCIQNGASRRTALLSELAAYVVISLCLAVFGELLVLVSRAVVRADNRLVLSDLYQILYLGFGTESMSLGQHLLSILFSFMLMLVSGALGSFISLGFYRLSKGWTIAVAVGVPLLFTLGLPMLTLIPAVYALAAKVALALFTWLLASVWNFLLFDLLCYAALMAFNRLLSMRAPIRAAK